MGEDAELYALASHYQDCGIAPKRLIKFTEAVGAQIRLVVQEKTVNGHPFERQLKADWYRASVRRTNSEVDEDWYIKNLSRLLERPTNVRA